MTFDKSQVPSPCPYPPSKVVREQQVAAVKELIARFLPDKADIFHLNIVQPASLGTSSFSIESCNGGVRLEGSSGVELASAFNWFLKYFCQSSVTWNATGGAQIRQECLTPEGLSRLESRGKMTVNRAVQLSYYQNICTYSYSMAYWDWERWEQEIDWMALQGINLPLAPAGVECIWKKAYLQLGLSESDVADFFPGPSFLAWGRMGNIQGYGGPLPDSYMDQQLKLQTRIIERMRSFGMTPVFPAFSGFVPRALVAKHPDAKVIRISNWCHFPQQYCCPFLLDPTDPLFKQVGVTYLQMLREQFGSDAVGFYTADLFNEMRPTCSQPEYLTNLTKAVYETMTEVDPSAVWLMQAWLFFSDPTFWQPEQVRALLSGVPRGNLVLLDLFAEEHPIWERTSSFFGYPFIWCMLHNFGGNLEMYGALPGVIDGVSRALKTNSTIVGVGMAPEGLEQNPVVYDLMSEMGFEWRSETFSLPHWVHEYAQRRYGMTPGAHVEEAWRILLATAYSCRDRQHNTIQDVPTSRPGLSRMEIIGWGLSPHLWYDLKDMLLAWEYMLTAVNNNTALGSSAAFKYDLVDISREVLSKLSTDYWRAVVHMYLTKAGDQMQQTGQQLLGLLQDMDDIMGTHRSFLLGRHLERAKGWGKTEQEKAFFEANARTQITIWGTSDSGDSEVSDYANREWSGLISTFYKPRWALWLQRLQEDLQLGRPYDAETWRRDCVNFTRQWANDRQPFPVEPVGDLIKLSVALHQKYGPTLIHIHTIPLPPSPPSSDSLDSTTIEVDTEPSSL